MQSFTETTTTTFKPEWVRKEFLPYNEMFRKARHGMKKMDKCRKCKHLFEDGEMMALASFGKKGNKVLCRDCADELSEDSP